MSEPPRTHTGAALAGLAIALALSAAGWWAGRHDRAAGRLPQEGYIWQRAWASEAVADAARQGLTGVAVLAAEADLAQNPPRIAELAVTPAPPATGGGRAPELGLALRIGPFPKRFAEAPATAEQVIVLARNAVARAVAAGWRVRELQIDFDCASARLDDYAQLVRRVRRVVTPVPVAITALPVWLARRSGFSHLAAAADGYVLQVHSLVRPASAASPLVLCDPVAARAAVDDAAGYRRPFRVALPTYGYIAAFAPAGKPFLGLWAEGPPIRWPPGTLLRTARSDPDAMAALVAAWTRDRPRQLTGILWYRLPAPHDRLNWAWPTLRAVMAGRAPRHDLRLAVRPPAAGDPPGLQQIEIANLGEAAESWPAQVQVHWSGGAANLLAADGLAGYQLHASHSGQANLAWSPLSPATAPGSARAPAPEPMAAATSPPAVRAAAPRNPATQDLPALAPGSRRLIAWLRFDRPTTLQAAAGGPGGR